MSSSSRAKGNDDKPRDWAELPSELTYSILLRLGAVEILDSAQKVCTSWRRVSKDPSMWQKIDMRDLGNHGILDYNFSSICRLAVDCSEGCLVDINFGDIGEDSLLNYVADRSSNLRRLTLAIYFAMTNEGLVNAVRKLPLLEELEVSHSRSKLNLKDIGCSCPQLKTLKLNCFGYVCSHSELDDDALAIAESMPEIRHLELLGNRLTDTGLNAILDGCPHLEHLDLRKCFNVDLVGNLEKRCSEMIKDFRRPNDSTDDYPYGTTFVDDTDVEDDIYGYDDFEEDYDLYVHDSFDTWW